MTDSKDNRVYEGDVCIQHGIYGNLLFEIDRIDDEKGRVFPVVGSFYFCNEKEFREASIQDVPHGLLRNDFMLLRTARGTVMQKGYERVLALYDKQGV